MLASGAKVSVEEVEEAPQDSCGLDGEDGGEPTVVRTYPASDTIFLSDGNSSRISFLPLTIIVLYRLWFVMSDRGLRRANWCEVLIRYFFSKNVTRNNKAVNG
jgi:hypothetical protein